MVSSMVGVETGILRIEELGVRVRELLEKYHVVEVIRRDSPRAEEIFPKPEALGEDELLYRAYKTYRHPTHGRNKGLNSG